MKRLVEIMFKHKPSAGYFCESGSAFFVATASMLALLSGCTTVPENNAGAASNSVIPRAEPFSPPTVAQLVGQAAAKGWSFQIESRSATSSILFFARPQTLARVGNYARFSQLEIRETPLKVGSTWAMATVSTVQFDCSARTSQYLNVDIFNDRGATQRIASTQQALALNNVQVGSVADLMIQKACSGSFGGGQIALAPGSTGVVPRPSGNSSGSGIILAKGAVVTNQHVVASCGKLDVVYEGQRYAATVKKRDAKNDLALLEAPDLPAKIYPSLRRKALSGEGVMVAGYPLSGMLSSDMIVTDGIVNALSGLANDASQLQISAPVQPGNSGGPLIDKSGALVGVVVSKLNALRAAALTGDIAQNINFAIKPEVLRAFLESENLPIVSSDPGTRLETEVLAQKAKAFTLKVECKNSVAS